MSADHRQLGRELGLFRTDPLVGAGLPLWLPAGAIVRGEIGRLAAEEAASGGGQRVYTPVLAKRELFERSGHWAKFAADMFPPMVIGSEEFVLRPANCPHHAMIYAAEQRSFRDLPVRLSEPGSMFRSEPSGVLGGLSWVRQINLDELFVFLCLSRRRGPRSRCAGGPAGRDRGSNGVSGPITLSLPAWRERCRDDRDTGDVTTCRQRDHSMLLPGHGANRTVSLKSGRSAVRSCP